MECKFYSILFYSVLFYSILLYSILFYSILFHSILFHSILFYSFPYFLYSVLFYSILFCSFILLSVHISGLTKARRILLPGSLREGSDPSENIFRPPHPPRRMDRLKIFTLNRKKTVSCRVTWASSERVNL